MSHSPYDWRTCAADLFQHHEMVLERLAKQNPSVDREDLHDAFVKAILEISAKPEKFDTSRKTEIDNFLAGAAKRALLQILRTHRRRKRREEKKAEAVADDRPAARPTLDIVADADYARQARAVASTEEERNVLRLWELGHADAEIAQQLAMVVEAVRRIRDRLTQRLRRLRHHSSGEQT
jgi:RNA polymerase sigma factor (sigma-70 family)